MKKHLVIGCLGEVGSSLFRILKESEKRGSNIKSMGIDLNFAESMVENEGKFDFLHICIPGNDLKYEEKTMKYIERYLNTEGIVIIHSTVYPGTTHNISKLYEHVVYSPVRGRHPNLYHYLQKYHKYFASESLIALDEVKNGLKMVFPSMKFCFDTTALEYAKHQSTMSFGYNLILAQELAQKSRDLRFDPGIVVDFVNDTGRHLQDRKIYPYIEKIGGHCVIQNAEMISKISPLAKNLVDINKDFGNFYKDTKFILFKKKLSTNHDEE